jgi:serine phosphatase RsbU (regulator of sigma subunit)
MNEKKKTALYDQEFIDNLTRQKKELTDSLQYARNIQKTILPSYEKVSYLFPENFVLFLPRDIVSGDFYWVQKIDNNIIFTVGDCTGHGVPGAFMSILGIIFLNEITNHTPLLPANQILNALRERIMKTLNQTGKDREQKDGMDLALCIYNEKDKTLQYSGANNSLYHFHNNELNQVKPDRMPIGVSGFYEESFTNNILQINKNDRVYLFTDGYADQFGGDHDEKYKIKRFRQLLSNIQQYSMPVQKKKLEEAHKNWKGENEQIDDILILGIGF